MITIACIELHSNFGTYRKDIWNYLVKHFDGAVDYREFLFVVSNLVKAGKLNNNEGKYQANKKIEEDMMKNAETTQYVSMQSKETPKAFKRVTEDSYVSIKANSEKFKEKIRAPSPPRPARTVQTSQKYDVMGGKRTQQKLDELFAKQSACKKNLKRINKTKPVFEDPLADIKRRLGIKDEEPPIQNQATSGTKSLGFLKVKQTSLVLDSGGLGFKK